MRRWYRIRRAAWQLGFELAVAIDVARQKNLPSGRARTRRTSCLARWRATNDDDEHYVYAIAL
jgi:hypothetical protein